MAPQSQKGDRITLKTENNIGYRKDYKIKVDWAL